MFDIFLSFGDYITYSRTHIWSSFEDVFKQSMLGATTEASQELHDISRNVSMRKYITGHINLSELL